jgi:uncharacterized membrane protein
MLKIQRNPKSKARTKTPQISPTSTIDVSHFQETTVEIAAEITRHPLSSGPFANRESKLRVKISNHGDSELENVSVEAIAPQGTILVDPGILFGTTRRHVRLPRLLPGKSVTYKLGIRAREGFSSGVLLIDLKESAMNSQRSAFQVKVGLSGTSY